MNLYVIHTLSSNLFLYTEHNRIKHKKSQIYKQPEIRTLDINVVTQQHPQA
jgi:hypothetical protein